VARHNRQHFIRALVDALANINMPAIHDRLDASPLSIVATAVDSITPFVVVIEVLATVWVSSFGSYPRAFALPIPADFHCFKRPRLLCDLAAAAVTH
jgi:hypothetical protein